MFLAIDNTKVSDMECEQSCPNLGLNLHKIWS